MAQKTESAKSHRRFLNAVGMSEREEKPRKKGLTVIYDPVPDMVLERYGDFVDIIKLNTVTVWAPAKVMSDSIKKYRQHNIDVFFGGSMFYDLAKLNNVESEFFDEARISGVNVVEYDAKPGTKIDTMKEEVSKLKDRGFRVLAEVGSKWFTEDDSRLGRDKIDVGKTIHAFEQYLEAGCEKVTWEGLIIRSLIGKKLDNREGQKAIREVVNSVGLENIILEVWGPEMTSRDPPRFWSWLVYEFGPDVSIGNVEAAGVSSLEQVRRGTYYEMQYPYIRWIDENKPTRNWWKMEQPPYDVYL